MVSIDPSGSLSILHPHFLTLLFIAFSHLIAMISGSIFLILNNIIKRVTPRNMKERSRKMSVLEMLPHSQTQGSAKLSNSLQIGAQ